MSGMVLSELESMERVGMNKGVTKVHVTTLDEVVSVNTFFTVAVFIGMAFGKDQESLLLDDNASCKPSADTVKHLMVFEVVSFSFFLFSTLVAHGMKLFVIFSSSSRKRGGNSSSADESSDQQQQLLVLSGAINSVFLRFGMLASAVGTVLGTLLLMVSMVNIIQLRLGSLSCSDGWSSSGSSSAAIPLVVLVATGISIFISSAFYAFLH